MTCKGCVLEVSQKRLRRHAVFCSNKCRNVAYKNEWRMRNATAHKMSRSTVGAMAEILVSLDLMKRGFHVFRALSPNASCDLAIVNDRQFLRVEVKTSYRTRSGTIYSPQVKAGTHDILALVLDRKEVVYRGMDNVQFEHDRRCAGDS